MAKNNGKKPTTKKRNAWQQNPMVVLLLGLVLLGVCYGAASWAIDSGRWSMYIITFASLYYGVRYLYRAIRLFF